MVDISVDELKNSSTSSLIRIRDRIEEEIQKRHTAKRMKLINDFREAFEALRDENITISHCGQYDETEHFIYNWDEFNFE